jgi:hypothetical protein
MSGPPDHGGGKRRPGVLMALSVTPAAWRYSPQAAAPYGVPSLTGSCSPINPSRPQAASLSFGPSPFYMSEPDQFVDALLGRR